MYPEEYWPVEHSESQAIFDNFISKLEAFLGAQKTMISLQKLWKEQPPAKTKPQLTEYFEHTFSTVASYDQGRVLDKFFSDYKGAFGGSKPVLDPQLQVKL